MNIIRNLVVVMSVMTLAACYGEWMVVEEPPVVVVPAPTTVVVRRPAYRYYERPRTVYRYEHMRTMTPPPSPAQRGPMSRPTQPPRQVGRR